KESMIPNIFESKPPRGRKPASVPTTEGVTINEQVNAFHNPLGRPPYKPHPAPTPAYTPPPPQPGPYLHPAPMPAPTLAYAPPPPQHGPYFPPAPMPAPAPTYAYPPQQPRPMPVQRQYHNVPPPNAFPRPGQKRLNYPPLPESLEDIFAVFMAHGVLNLPPRPENWSPRADTGRYCPYHRAPGHTISACFQFRDWVYDMHDAGRINWADLKKAIAVMKAPPPPPAD